jgi:hypothetical protein
MHILPKRGLDAAEALTTRAGKVAQATRRLATQVAGQLKIFICSTIALETAAVGLKISAWGTYKPQADIWRSLFGDTLLTLGAGGWPSS